MKKSRSFFAVLIVSLSYVLSPVTAKADLWDVPVAPGETFRWVFVTSEFTDAFSSDIGYYNTFVNAAADDAATPITGVLGKSTIADIEWMAIASTESVNAIDNIGYSLAGIFTPKADLVANGTPDLFDGSLIPTLGGAISYTEDGWWRHGFPVWTGSDIYGLGEDWYRLGDETFGIIGIQGRYDTDWISYGNAELYNTFSLYAISEELTVVPVPGALILGATGLLSSTLGLKRLRRRHQE